MSHFHRRPPPLNISRLKNKLIDERHRTTLTQNHQSQKNDQKKLSNVGGLKEAPVASDELPEGSIVMLNSPDIRFDSFDDLKKQKQKSILKIMKVECSEQSTVQKEKMPSVLGLYSNQKIHDSLAELSAIGEKRDYFKYGSVPSSEEKKMVKKLSQELDTLPHPQQVAASVTFKNHSTGQLCENILKIQKDDSLEIVPEVGIQSRIQSPDLKSKDDHSNFGTTPIAKTQENQKKKYSYERDSRTQTQDKGSNLTNFNKTVAYRNSPNRQISEFSPTHRERGYSEFDIRTLLGSNIEKKNEDANLSTFSPKKQANKLIKMFVSFNLNKPDEETEKLKTVMFDQQNLKLKDYLRLASLSNDSKMDRYSNSLKIKANQQLELRKPSPQNEQVLKKSYIFNKNKTAIDPSKSILLIKASLQKKLFKAIETSLKIMDEIGDNSNFLSAEYEDLVFMCNIHRVFDDNMFKSVGLLEELMDIYTERRHLKTMISNKELTETNVLKILSPRKPKRRQEKSEEFDIKNMIQIILDKFVDSKPK